MKQIFEIEYKESLSAEELCGCIEDMIGRDENITVREVKP